jgi:uncharacterized protein (TIGR03085 family)
MVVRVEQSPIAADFFDAVERAQLCDLLEELGPDGLTLLHPWTTRDLAAHLLLRENDVLAAPGLVVPGSWARFAERRRRQLAASGYAGLVARLRHGPPWGMFRLPPVRRVANLNEFFVHHEDVRRANGGDPRVLSSGEDQALFGNVAAARRMLLMRSHGFGLDIEWAGTDTAIRSRGRAPRVRLRGLPGELLLHLFGREEPAQVDVAGPPEAIELWRRRPRPWWWGTD